MEVNYPAKIYILDNCHECPLIYRLDTGGKFCAMTDTCVDDYDADFMDEPAFPPDCPLKDA